MGGFDRDWLRLRAPFDDAARDATLTRRLAAALPDEPRLLDLAAGTGANLRHLSPRLRRPGQRWVLADHDPVLLDTAAAEMAACAHPLPAFETRRVDLSRDLESLDFRQFDAVVATALFDLVSADWMDRFVAALAAAPRPVLVTLSVDGRLRWSPEDPGDAAVRGWIERHQATDKGFGPALGPEAPRHLADALRACGFAVETAASDWIIGPADAAMHLALIEGYRGAALEIAPEGESSAIEGWAERRRAAAAAGTLEALVGHVDIFAEPR
ncbi:class I SAM-dependent methyltransferase [Skermanella rosea]|uniref:class I SAM-dependent methyltransferase n=1 Tax=Skermanella rosea TaxID=1817965 RepID=UPI001931F1FA|nr:class I SAM-dependent methyltransferase [Skermanella rosea]UEM03571.1 class I SAM-dependent methyltransferase [Skermanella rosea]